jgi:arylsulfatase A-like enzyme
MKIHPLVLTAIFSGLAAAAPPKPNIVLIYADDLGYGDLSCNGATAVRTPNADRLAKEGLNFSSGYCSSATCTPSRYSMLTGEYAFRQKGTGILPGDAKLIIEPGRASLASALKSAGYKTGVVGKWHLGLGDGNIDWNGEIKPSPNEIGFDDSFIMAATGDRVPCVYVRNHRIENLDPADPIQVSYNDPFPGEPDGQRDRASLKMDWSHGHNSAVINGVGRIGYMKGGRKAIWNDETMAETFAKEAVSFIERSKDQPFFLYFATHNVHVPRIPNPKFVGKTTMGPRGDSIAEFDWQVGEVLAALDRLKLTENTLVILTSDNGPVLDDGYKDDAVEKLGTHKPAGPFRGGKYSTFEGGTRMPFLVRWTGRVKPGTTTDAIISQVDFPATFAALAGTSFPKERAPDTRNLLPVLLGETRAGRDHVLEHSGNVAVRAGDWKLIPGKAKKKAGPAWLLYNLSKDPGESTDIAAENPEKVEELRKLLPTAEAASPFHQ